MYLNEVLMIGRMVEDAEGRYAGEKLVASFRLAVDRGYKKKGSDKSETDFFNVEVWDKLAEFCANYGKKGRLVAVKGSMTNDNWVDKEGVKKYRDKIRADTVRFLEKKQTDESESEPE